jgi:hypothetical protein
MTGSFAPCATAVGPQTLRNRQSSDEVFEIPTFLTAVDDLGDAEGSQLSKCGGIIALDSVSAREVHPDHLRRHRISLDRRHPRVLASGQDAISSTTGLADRLSGKDHGRRKSQ